MGLLREQCAEWKKVPLQYCGNQVWTINGGRIPWNATAICEIFRISNLMGKDTIWKAVRNGPVIPFGAMVEYHPISAKDLYRDYTNLVQKSYQRYTFDMRYTRGESGNETYWSRTLKNWSRWTHLKFTPEGSMQRKCWRRWKWQFHIPCRRWNSQNFWLGSASDTIHLDPGSPSPRRTRSSSRRIRRTLFSNTSSSGLNTRWCGSQKWFLVHDGRFHLTISRGTQSQTVRAERRIISYSAEIYRRYQKHTYITWCNAGENIDDYWNGDGERELPDKWTGFTRFTILKEKPPDGYTWSGERLTRKQTTSRLEELWPEMWKHMSDAS